MNAKRTKPNDLWDPFAEFERLEQEIDQLFGLDRGSFSPGLFDRSAIPAVDVVETPEEFVVCADLPGVELKDLDLSFADNVLTLRGVTRELEPAKEARIYRNDLWSGEFQRTFALPRGVNPDRISASLKDGLLTIALPKRDEAKPKQISVSVR